MALLHSGREFDFSSDPEARDLLDISKVQSVYVELYTVEEIHALSELEITEDDIHSSGRSVRSDTLKGSGSTGKCGLCTVIDCVGHYGHIDFVKPIPHPTYLPVIVKILNSICLDCGTIRNPGIIDKKTSKQKGKSKLEIIAKKMKTSECVSCKAKALEVMGAKTSNSGGIIYMAFSGSKKTESNMLDGQRLKEIFARISVITAQSLGFRDSSEIQRMLVESMLVMPLTSRPDPNPFSKHKLTVDLGIILKANRALGDSINATNIDVTSKYMALYNAYKSFRDSIKSILDTKKGLYRCAMVGKRSNIQGRAVLGPADDVRFGEIIIPESMTRYLTPEEVVTIENIEIVRELNEKGFVVYVRTHKENIIEMDKHPDYEFKIGETIGRCLMNGDRVFFWRQPVIHKTSMLSARAVIRAGRSTIGLPLKYAKNLNADFDGDEMNVSIPIGREAKLEAQVLMSVEQNITSGENCATSMGLVMDELLSIFLMTDFDVIISETVTMNVRMKILSQDWTVDFEERLETFSLSPGSGRALFSSILPYDFTYVHGDVTILKGILVKGRINSKHVGNEHRTIISDIEKYYGWERASMFLSDTTILAQEFLRMRGFSIGLSDCAYTLEGESAECARKYDAELAESISKLGPRSENALEEQERIGRALKIYGDYSNKMQDLDRFMDTKNPLRLMSKGMGAGSKGSKQNIAQLSSIVGPQNIRGVRVGTTHKIKGVPYLPYFKEDEDTMISQGICKSSFVQGLRPPESMMHSAAVRADLATKTTDVPDVGKVYKNLQSGTQSIKTEKFTSVVNANSRVIQLVYGGDGLNPTQMRNVDVPHKSGMNFSFYDVAVRARHYNTLAGWTDAN